MVGSDSDRGSRQTDLDGAANAAHGNHEISQTPCIRYRGSRLPSRFRMSASMSVPPSGSSLGRRLSIQATMEKNPNLVPSSFGLNGLFLGHRKNPKRRAPSALFCAGPTVRTTQGSGDDLNGSHVDLLGVHEVSKQMELRMKRKLLFVIVATLVAVIAALLAGIVSTAGGAHLPVAIQMGAAAFAVTLPLVLTVMSTIGLV